MDDEKKAAQIKPEPRKKKKKGFREQGFWGRMAAKKLEWFVFILGTALTAVILWPFIAVTVEPGHTGVYFSRLFGGTRIETPRGEGLRFKLPWDVIIHYDSRLQSKDYEVIALTKGGLNVTVEMSVLWFVSPEQAPRLHVDTGPDYVARVIDPTVVSTVRSVIGNLEQNLLYDGDPLHLQEAVLALLRETLVDKSFKVHSILIREVILPPDMRGAITDKFVAEQNVLEARYNVLESIERFKQTFVDAEATRISQYIVNDGMSEAYLRFLGIQATLELARSPNAKLVIIGDKDGMPLILNPGTLDVSMTLPTGPPPDSYIPEGEEGARMNELLTTYDMIQGYLSIMDSVLGDLMNQFPTADPSIGDTGLPQDNRIPTIPRIVEGD